MTEAEARQLLLVRAVETQDAGFAIFTAEDRQLATAAGLQQAGGRGRHSPQGDDEHFLVGRSAFAFARLATRVPALARIDRQIRWPGWIDWALPGLALTLGFLSNEMDAVGQLNIIAFPLLSMLAWNLAVFLALAALPLRHLARGPSAPVATGHLARLVNGVLARARRAERSGTVTARAIAGFVPDWLEASSSLNQARIRRTLHLSAAALAAGVLLGMYARALGVEYRAGWESTFIDAGTLHRLVQVVLAPASALTGVALPGVDQLEAIRWGPGQDGENAGPWIHLFATTAALFIIGPRLLLAGWEALRAGGLAGRMPVPGREDVYTRRLLANARDVGVLVRVVPYSFHLSGEAVQRLDGLLRAVLGDRAQVSIDTSVAFGAEDAWLDGLTLDPETDNLVVLFNLSATPEAEIHGGFIARLKARIDQERGGPALTVIVDESAYSQRLAGQAGSVQRLEARRLDWKSVIGRSGVLASTLNLASEDGPALLSQLESLIMREPALTPGGRAR